ncbi:hypothetical protein AB4205_04300 [Vibrio sp. 10N.286.49.F3]|uniref:hypothetical protein n=1 Tax=Vibrio sp. 10N.286.49.F3 TaxID=3229704 RepID=UPI00354B61E2
MMKTRDYAAQIATRDHLISQSKHAGEKANIQNVFDALVKLSSENIAIKKVKVAEYIKKNLGGKPSEGTLNNDPKGIYRQLFESFEKVDPEQVSVPTSAKTKSNEELVADNDALRKSLLRATRKIEVLENVITKNFEDLSAKGEEFSTRKYLLESNADDSSLKQGLVSPPTEDEATLKAFAKMYDHFVKQGLVETSGNLLIDVDTGAVILTKSETELLMRHTKK